MTTDQSHHQRIRNLSHSDAEHLMTSIARELEKLREVILKKNRSRPDANLLVKGIGTFSHFEFLAVAAYRSRGKWEMAQTALDAIESWRKEWNLVASAAIVHAKADLEACERNSPEFNRSLKTILDLVSIIGMTFRPLTGPQSKWLGVQASAVDKDIN